MFIDAFLLLGFEPNWLSRPLRLCDSVKFYLRTSSSSSTFVEYAAMYCLSTIGPKNSSRNEEPRPNIANTMHKSPFSA